MFWDLLELLLLLLLLLFLFLCMHRVKIIKKRDKKKKHIPSMTA